MVQCCCFLLPVSLLPLLQATRKHHIDPQAALAFGAIAGGWGGDILGHRGFGRAGAVSWFSLRKYRTDHTLPLLQHPSPLTGATSSAQSGCPNWREPPPSVGIASSTATFPFEVARRRMMMGAPYPNMAAAIATILQQEGVAALFNGAWAGVVVEAMHTAYSLVWMRAGASSTASVNLFLTFDLFCFKPRTCFWSASPTTTAAAGAPAAPFPQPDSLHVEWCAGQLPAGVQGAAISSPALPLTASTCC